MRLLSALRLHLPKFRCKTSLILEAKCETAWMIIFNLILLSNQEIFKANMIEKAQPGNQIFVSIQSTLKCLNSFMAFKAISSTSIC